MSAFIIKLLRGERPIIYGTGEKRRDFIYVDDVNDFHLRCIDDERTKARSTTSEPASITACARSTTR